MKSFADSVRSGRLAAVCTALCLATAGSLQAHTGQGDLSGWPAGFHHPIGGLDHLLAMIAVGLWAAQGGRRSLWVLPTAFPTAMLLGAALAMAGIAVPGVEVFIALSAVGIGLAVFSSLRLPVWAAGLVVAGFALFHGHAHGAELPAGADAGGYLTGFVTATALLHAVGVALGLTARLPACRPMIRSAGLAVAVCGAFFLQQAVGG